MTTKEWKEERDEKHLKLLKEYARQSYLVSEENHPVEDEIKALKDIIDFRHQDYIALLDHVMTRMPENKRSGHRELTMEYKDGWNDCLEVLQEVRGELL